MKHGALVVKSNRVVGHGVNKPVNHPSVVSREHLKTKCSLHAEAVAIKRAGPNATGAVLYVARVNKRGQQRYSEPCNSCRDLIAAVGIKRVIYT